MTPRNVGGAAALVVALAAGAAAQMPPMPKPGPEHAIWKDVAGTWDAKVEMFMGPGEPALSTGVEENRIGCGGLCLITDFKGAFGAETFEGHGVEAWDPAKKKFVVTWTDSMSTGLAIGEATHDPATRTMTGWLEGPDPTGKVVKSKSVAVMKDPVTRVFSMYSAGPDGKESLGMRITYTKRK